jgi:hypothetical protein
VETTPVVAPAAVAPNTVAPKAVVSVPKVSTVLPPVSAVVTSRPVVAAPIKTLPQAALALTKTTLVLHAAPLLSSPSKQKRPTMQLVTMTGSIYKNVEVQRVMSDGIIISYTPTGGGWAMTKVNFGDLSPEQQQRYQKH